MNVCLYRFYFFTSGGKIILRVLTANKHPQRVKQKPIITSKGTRRTHVGGECGFLRGASGDEVILPLPLIYFADV